MIRSLTWRTIIITGLALSLLACGKKMPPRPPHEVVPQAVTGFFARLTDKAIVLAWKPPIKRKDGSPLTRLSGFRVLRASYEFTEDCPGCPVHYTDIFNVRWPGPNKETATEDLVKFVDSDLTYGHKYVYTVQAVDDDGRIGAEAEPVIIYWDAPPGPPAALNAQAGDGQVVLDWKAPERLSDGSAVGEPLSYYIYRRKGDGPYERLVMAGLLSNTAFTDTALANDACYTYKVHAVRSVRDTLIEGPESGEVTALPKDMTPPAPPAGLSAIASPEGIVLRWIDNTEPDLAGYRVYRRTKEEDKWQCLSREPEKSVRYTDKEVHKGEVYHYAVTALDSSPRQNESTMSLEVRVWAE
ncbi:MAG: fibronectin type III domain-containing protein [Thermodesulfobacteriota bacterium]